MANLLKVLKNKWNILAFSKLDLKTHGRLTNQFFHAKCLLDAWRVGGFAGGCFKNSAKNRFLTKQI